MADFLSLSPEAKSEYCCNIVKIGEVKPIEGSDFLGQTFINGCSMVVRKDQVKEGAIMFYAPNESQLHSDFLGINNLFEIGCYEKNSNYLEVEKLLNDNKKDEAKRKVGFFNKHGRVRMIRLRGVPSMGFLFTLDEMAKYNPKAKTLNMEDYLNKDFDTVDGELFVHAYVPPMPEQSKPRTRSEKRQKKLNLFDRIVPGEFAFHYDTNPLAKNMHRINPTDKLAISVKVHGTSAIFANVKTRIPVHIDFYKRWWNKFVDYSGWFKKSRFIDYVVDYGDVYSSRTVIKNKEINQSVTSGYYKVDVWGEYNDMLKNYIPKGMTLYGEIFGYITDSATMIQKEFDYGCAPGTNKFMPYRITMENPDGGKVELNIEDVVKFTEGLIAIVPENIKNRLMVLPVLYHGTLADLYPHLDVNEHWHENVLMELKNDTTHFGMEKLEPMCNKKVPREGICVRIDDDITSECFKLKTDMFAEKEAKSVDAGNVDIEMAEAYA